mmetsp:Transcript_55020/g.130603  ORF Transcript_55020/g.130603 Transcript_55020/m.130603 type:complete len:315 (-) Transcript_55020:415-1359(-)
MGTRLATEHTAFAGYSSLAAHKSILTHTTCSGPLEVDGDDGEVIVGLGVLGAVLFDDCRRDRVRRRVGRRVLEEQFHHLGHFHVVPETIRRDDDSGVLLGEDVRRHLGRGRNSARAFVLGLDVSESAGGDQVAEGALVLDLPASRFDARALRLHRCSVVSSEMHRHDFRGVNVCIPPGHDRAAVSEVRDVQHILPSVLAHHHGERARPAPVPCRVHRHRLLLRVLEAFFEGARELLGCCLPHLPLRSEDLLQRRRDVPRELLRRHLRNRAAPMAIKHREKGHGARARVEEERGERAFAEQVRELEDRETVLVGV